MSDTDATIAAALTGEGRDARIYSTRHGPMFGLQGDRYISRSLEVYGEFSWSEARLLERLVQPGQTVVEVGANIGAHTVLLARRCAPGLVYAFEPQQRVFQLLCANLALNDIRNVIARPEACGEEPGEVIVPAVDYGAALNFGGLSVQAADSGVLGHRTPLTRLDDLPLEACHLLKIDVEGFEPEVLRGAVAMIARFRPLIYVENDRPAQQQEVISLIAAMGYRQYWHTPPLFNPQNAKGVAENIFGTLVSVNMLCIPSERPDSPAGITAIDPDNWTSPVKVA
ncbi:MAG: FkbM family methyltransferase [Phenylobacterium sp.]